MRKIFKYEVPAGGDECRVRMPAGSRVLRFGAQGDELVLWAMVDPDAPMVTRTFMVVATGQPVAEAVAEAHYVGTVQMTQGARPPIELVWHMFEVPSTTP